MHSKTQFFYVDAPCGAGKTHSFIQFVVNNKNDVKLILSVPSKKLSKQIADELITLGITVFEINHTTPGNGTVKSKIEAAMQKINIMGCGVIICTDVGHSYIPEHVYKLRSGWIHVKDENLELYKPTILNLPYSHHALTDLIQIVELTAFKHTYIITIKNKTEAEKILAKHNDDYFDLLKPLLRRIIDNKYRVYVDKTTWDKIVLNGIITPDLPGTKSCLSGVKVYGTSENKLYFTSILTPQSETGYAKTIFMSANLFESSLFQYWHKNYKIHFIEHEEISKNLRFKTHTNGHLLEITYLQERSFSRYQATKIHKETGKTGIQLNIEAAIKVLDPTKPILAICNKDDEHECPKTWDIISPQSYGLNDFINYTQCVFIGAYNLDPKIITLLTNLGISKESIYRDMQSETCYQSVLRLGLRNPDNKEQIKIFVTSKKEAEYLAGKFPGAIIKSVDGKNVQKVVGKIGKSQTERRRLALLAELDQKYNLLDIIQNEQLQLFANSHISEMKPNMDIFPDNLFPNNVLPNYTSGNLGITSYDHFSGVGSLEFGDVKELTNTLKKYSKHNFLNNKHDQTKLINANYYLNNNRQLVSVLGTSCIILDVDGGDMSIDEFNTIFHDKFKWTYCAYSTVSHKIKDENRYRVIIFTSTFMTPPIYNEIYDHILEILEQYNFYTAPQSKNPKDAIDFITNIRKTNLKAQLSGIDLSKKNLSSIFKVPATLYGNEENRFFYESYLGLSRDFPRHVVNVPKIIKSRLAKLKTIANYETDYDLIIEPISYNDGLVAVGVI